MTDAPRSDAPQQPERGAARNRRDLAADAPGTSDPVLPSLDPGVTCLDVDGRGVPVLQSLALDHLLVASGPAFWVDTAGCARTTTLAQIAPSWRLLERVQVARGFTPYKHYAAVADLPDAIDQFRADQAVAEAEPPALFVAPVVDGRYRDADDLPREHARQLLARTLARLRRYADAYDAPVLVTTSGGSGDPFGDVVSHAVDHELRCERTPLGPRFVGDDETETLVYPQPDGTLQTTLAYWRTILTQRAAAAGVSTDGPTPTAPAGADGALASPDGAVAGADGGAGPAGAAGSVTPADPTGGVGHGVAHERALSPWRGDR